MPPLIHPVYSMIADGDRTREDRPFQVRDSVAGEQVRQPLLAQGFSLGDVILNFPPQPRHQGDPHARIDTSRCRPDALLQGSTRLPSSDVAQGARRQLRRACTDLEDDMIAAWDPWVPRSSRLHVTLSERLGGLLPEAYEDRRDMFFYEKPGAPYNKLCREDGGRPHKYRGAEHRTAAFLLRLPRLGERNVGYLRTWALDGNANLIWSCLLRHRHPELLMEPGFVFAELVGGGIPQRPFDLRWTLDWRAEILIREPIRSVEPLRSGGPAPHRGRAKR